MADAGDAGSANLDVLKRVEARSRERTGRAAAGSDADDVKKAREDASKMLREKKALEQQKKREELAARMRNSASNAEVEQLRAEVTDLKAKMEALKSELDDATRETNEQRDSAAAKIEDLEKQLDASKQTLGTKASELETELQSTKEALTKAEASLTTTKAALDAAEAERNKLKGEVTDLTVRVANEVAKSTSTADQQQSEMTRALDSLQAKVNSVQEAHNATIAEKDELKQQMEAAAETAAAAKSELEGQIEELKQTLENHEDTLQKMGQVGAAQKQALEAKDAEIEKAQKEIQTLNVWIARSKDAQLRNAADEADRLRKIAQREVAQLQQELRTALQERDEAVRVSTAVADLRASLEGGKGGSAGEVGRSHALDGLYDDDDGSGGVPKRRLTRNEKNVVAMLESAGDKKIDVKNSALQAAQDKAVSGVREKVADIFGEQSGLGGLMDVLGGTKGGAQGGTAAGAAPSPTSISAAASWAGVPMGGGPQLQAPGATQSMVPLGTLKSRGPTPSKLSSPGGVPAPPGGAEESSQTVPSTVPEMVRVIQNRLYELEHENTVLKEAMQRQANAYDAELEQANNALYEAQQAIETNDANLRAERDVEINRLRKAVELASARQEALVKEMQEDCLRELQQLDVIHARNVAAVDDRAKELVKAAEVAAAAANARADAMRCAVCSRQGALAVENWVDEGATGAVGEACLEASCCDCGGMWAEGRCVLCGCDGGAGKSDSAATAVRRPAPSPICGVCGAATADGPPLDVVESTIEALTVAERGTPCLRLLLYERPLKVALQAAAEEAARQDGTIDTTVLSASQRARAERERRHGFDVASMHGFGVQIAVSKDRTFVPHHGVAVHSESVKDPPINSSFSHRGLDLQAHRPGRAARALYGPPGAFSSTNSAHPRGGVANSRAPHMASSAGRRDRPRHEDTRSVFDRVDVTASHAALWQPPGSAGGVARGRGVQQGDFADSAVGGKANAASQLRGQGALLQLSRDGSYFDEVTGLLEDDAENAAVATHDAERVIARRTGRLDDPLRVPLNASGGEGWGRERVQSRTPDPPARVRTSSRRGARHAWGDVAESPARTPLHTPSHDTRRITSPLQESRRGNVAALGAPASPWEKGKGYASRSGGGKDPLGPLGGKVRELTAAAERRTAVWRFKTETGAVVSISVGVEVP